MTSPPKATHAQAMLKQLEVELEAEVEPEGKKDVRLRTPSVTQPRDVCLTDNAGSKRPALALVDTETGEITSHCPGCEDYEKQLSGAEKEIRAWRTRYANLKADRDAEAQTHKLWGLAVALFQEWKIASKHSRSGWNAERFWVCQPYLQSDGFVLCRWAVWGVAYEPMTKTLPSGLVERFDSFELAFKTRAHFERYCNRGRAHPEAKRLFADREKGIEAKPNE